MFQKVYCHFKWNLLLLFLICTPGIRCQTLVKRAPTLMGSRFEITIVAADSMQADRYIDEVIAEMRRIEHLISEWDASSQVSEVNRNAGLFPVVVDRELFDLTARALFFSEQSGGAFDISIAAMDKIWRFDGSMVVLPSADSVRKSVERVGYKNIVLDSLQSTIYLAKAGMKIGFGSIGKGYAADRGRSLMIRKGVVGGIVNASGDLATWGSKPDGEPWTIGVNNPFKAGRVVKVWDMTDEAVATSGSYEKYAEIDGKRYSHIINPKTGYPSTGLVSVSVVGPSAEFANGLSTSIMVLGVREGKLLLRQFPHYRGLFITDSGRIIRQN